MSLLQDMTYISLRGSRVSVIRMLNAVIRNVGGGDIITDNDDLEIIFRNCSSLEHVTISGNSKRVGPDCFRECTALTGIAIPEGVIKIDDGAFAGCTSLTDIVIPESLTEIEEHAFDDCPCVGMLASRYPNLKKESVEAKNSQEEKKATDEVPLDLPF